jgi:hypothetical protein
MMWRSGADDDFRWLQYGDFPKDDDLPTLSFLRRWRSRKVEIRLRLPHLDGSAPTGEETFLRRANFNVDAGEKSEIYVAGVGFIVQIDDGRVVFSTGSGTHGENLTIFHPVLAQITDQFGLLVEDEAYDFSIDPANKRVLDSLFDVPLLRAV